jgi:hypothetical protein
MNTLGSFFSLKLPNLPNNNDPLPNNYRTEIFNRIKDTANTLQVYDALFNFILEVLKPNNPSHQYSKFIQNTEIAFLEYKVKLESPPQIRFGISENGRREIIGSIAKDKKRVYDHWAKQNDFTPGQNGILNIEDADTLEQINAKIQTLSNAISTKNPIINKITTARTQTNKPNMVGKLFEAPTVTKDQYEEIVRIIVEQTRIRAGANSSSNSFRCKDICALLARADVFGVPYDTLKTKMPSVPNDANDNNAWAALVTKPAFYTQLTNFLNERIVITPDNSTGPFQQLLLDNALTFSGTEHLKECLSIYIRNRKAEYGISQLENIRKTDYFEKYETDFLLKALVAEVANILSLLVFNVNGAVAPNDFKDVTLFSLSNWDDLSGQRVGLVAPQNGTLDTLDLAYRPVLHCQRGIVYFLNLHAHFFFFNADSREMAYPLMNQVWEARNFNQSISFSERKSGIQVYPPKAFKTYIEGIYAEFFNQSLSSGFRLKGYYTQRFDWRALYTINVVSDTVRHLSMHLIWYAGFGGGHGIGRADGAEEEYYIWSSGNDESYKTGLILGLQHSRHVPFLQESTILSGDIYVNEVVEYNGERYVRVNIYNSNAVKVADAIPDDKTHFSYFDIAYYRKIQENADGGQYNVLKKDRKNYPLSNDENVPTVLSLPLDFYHQWNRIALDNKKRQTKASPQNDQTLGNNTNPRLNAGTVMKNENFISKFEPDVANLLRAPSALSADYFTATVLNRTNSAALKDWQAMKGTNQGGFPTAQEWCHLYGHGDGGHEVVDNFVSGSAHCNTEQLAIELGQRVITQSARNTTVFTLKANAYLLYDNSIKPEDIEETAPQNKLKRSATAVIEHDRKKMRRVVSEITPDRLESPQAPARKAAPIAAYISYAVHRKEDDKSIKVFEHLFEGQSEFFDKNQYNLLHYMVRFSLAPDDSFTAWFNAGVEDLQI